jgi:hypothetical protein
VHVCVEGRVLGRTAVNVRHARSVCDVCAFNLVLTLNTNSLSCHVFFDFVIAVTSAYPCIAIIVVFV